jgi:hypothetical protein
VPPRSWCWCTSRPRTEHLALCILHHKLLDSGVPGLTQDHRILVSMHFVARTSASRAVVSDYVGRELFAPQMANCPWPETTSLGTATKPSMGQPGQPKTRSCTAVTRGARHNDEGRVPAVESGGDVEGGRRCNASASQTTAT